MNLSHRITALLLILAIALPAAGYSQTTQPIELPRSSIIHDQDYGYNVDLDGDIAVVGAFRDDYQLFIESGAAFVYRFDGVSWNEEARLLSSDMQTSDWFGWDVAVSGDVILVTERLGDTQASGLGDVTVFRYTGNTWLEETVLTASDGIEGDFGYAIDIEGDVAAIGSPSRSVGVGRDDGAVYVFRHNGSQWIEDGILTASESGIQDLFGSAIDIDGDRMLISAFNADDSTSNQAGKLFVFDYDGTQWNETAILQSNRSNNIANLGVSVALEGDWAVGGAPLDNEVRGGAGAALVYRYDGTSWNFHSKLFASDGFGFFLFGSAMSLSGNRLLVTADGWAAPGEGSTGKAYLFEYDQTNDEWIEIDGLVPDNISQGASFGHAAKMQGDVIIIGAPEYDGMEDAMGAAFIYGQPIVVTSVDETLPESSVLVSDPFPNPFSHASTITVRPSANEPVRIVMYDMLGREVDTVFDGRLPADSPSSISISPKNFPNGHYWVRIQTSDETVSKSITLIR